MGATYTAADVKTLLAGAIREVEAGRMEATTGRTISTLAGQLLKALEAEGGSAESAQYEPRYHGKQLSELTNAELVEAFEYFGKESIADGEKMLETARKMRTSGEWDSAVTIANPH